MELGAFSVSLAVADLARSRSFYETLGFEMAGGDPDHGYVIMRNGAALVGLFQGMFEGHILTFNPGYAQDATEVEPFTDVRQIQAALLGAGLELTDRVDPDSKGPGHISFVDPDGNVILIDQFR